MAYDVIVIGARCAGSPAAMLLARQGQRVLLVDKSTLPSDTLSTHYIQQRGVALLAKWGLLDEVRATNCPPIRGVDFDFGPFVIKGDPPPAGDVADAFAPRRKVVDTVLQNAAVAAGVELRDATTLDSLLWDGDKVAGVRLRGRDGAVHEERCSLLIGADGLRSPVAQMVGAYSYNERPTYTCFYYSYWGDVPIDRSEIYVRPRCVTISFPTNDGLALVLVVKPAAEFAAFKADIEAGFFEAVDTAPSLSQRLRAGRRAERYYGTGDSPNFFRKPFGKGWALVGDAGHHRDPCTAQGISDAFLSADLVAAAYGDVAAGRAGWDEAFGNYEGTRNQLAMPMYELTCQRASFAPPPPEAMALLAAISRNPEQMNRFAGVDAGTVTVQDFFSPQNVGAIMSAAAVGVS